LPICSITTRPLHQPAARGQLDSSQTYGVRLGRAGKLAKGLSALTGSYAAQSNYGNNAGHYCEITTWPMPR
jgi:hypothetical protein